MSIYLTIMVTVLVMTQIIRITQNAIQLHRQEKAIAKDLAWLKDRDISERDFDVQRDCFYMLRTYLEKKLDINCDESDEDGEV